MQKLNELERRSKPLSNSLARSIYAHHPLGRPLVDWIVDLSMSVDRVISFKNAPIEIVEAFKKASKELDQEKSIKEAAKKSRIFGRSALYLVSTLGTHKPLLLDELIGRSPKFKAADPINVQGMDDLDPNSPNYLSTKNISIAGKRYDKSRVFLTQTGMSMFLEYTASAFSYTGRSIYQNCSNELDTILKATDALNELTGKGSATIYKSDGEREYMGTSTSEKTQRSIIQSIKTWLNNRKVIKIQGKDDIDVFDINGIQHVKVAYDTALTIIATSTDTPSQALTDQSYSSTMSEGKEDFNAMVKVVDVYQRDSLKPMYDYSDKIVIASMLTPDLLSSLKEKEEYQVDGQPMSDFMIMLQIFKTFEWEFGNIKPIDEAQEQSIKTEKLYNAQKVYEITRDPNWFKDEVNEEDLFLNTVDDFEPQEQPQEQFSQLGNPATIQTGGAPNIREGIRREVNPA